MKKTQEFNTKPAKTIEDMLEALKAGKVVHPRLGLDATFDLIAACAENDLRVSVTIDNYSGNSAVWVPRD